MMIIRRENEEKPTGERERERERKREKEKACVKIVMIVALIANDNR